MKQFPDLFVGKTASAPFFDGSFQILFYLFFLFFLLKLLVGG